MNSEINNVKCAQHMLDCTEGVDFPKTRKTKYTPEWISVKDRLPLYNQEVLGYENDHIGIVQLWDNSEIEEKDTWTERDIGTAEPTHWMELPELPSKSST